MTAYCYICNQNENKIALYYQIKFSLYIDPKNYTKPITDDLKPICENCLVPFIFKRQMCLNICSLCKCYDKYEGRRPIISNNCTEIHSNIPSRYIDSGNFNYSFNPENFNDLKAGDELCKKCFEEIISNPDSKKIIKNLNNEKKIECMICKTNKIEIYEQWANFDSDNVFMLGGLIEYKLTSNNYNVKKGDSICNDCIKSIEYQPYLGIECDICHKKFISLGNGMEGHGCAARINDTSICCGYGSKFDSDDESIKFVSERPNYLPYESLICDICIDELIKNGTCLPPIYHSN